VFIHSHPHRLHGPVVVGRFSGGFRAGAPRIAHRHR
jgi:hypothetical protein